MLKLAKWALQIFAALFIIGWVATHGLVGTWGDVLAMSRWVVAVCQHLIPPPHHGPLAGHP